MGFLAAFLAGAGVAVAALMAVKRRHAQVSVIAIEDLVDRCDRLASDLDRRVSGHVSA
jgi:hypothetical protein